MYGRESRQSTSLANNMRYKTMTISHARKGEQTRILLTLAKHKCTKVHEQSYGEKRKIDLHARTSAMFPLIGEDVNTHLTSSERTCIRM